MSKFEVQNFYDELSSSYHLMFGDWRASVRNQGDILDRFLKTHLSRTPTTILDCSVGIGTQAIGLALHGYQVHGTDISPGALTRLGVEMKNFGVSFTTQLADFRTLSKQVSGEYDLVLAGDNSVSHLLKDDDLNLAMKNIFEKVKPGGAFIATTRDYDALIKDRPVTTQPVFTEEGGVRKVSFQVWKWAQDMKTYDLEVLFFDEKGDRWTGKSVKGMYRALTRAELERSLGDAGFEDVDWYMPAESGFYQPLVLAFRPE